MKPLELSRKAPWVWAPYGNDNRRARRIERKRRRTETERLIREATDAE